ncbi:hypothetical protein [Pseudomonas putida]|jgi:hypothetical protein|uniref:hypothetical protein n=1 Tax=Pseudomonas putida TaxID=303 RepID=UPI0039E0CA21
MAAVKCKECGAQVWVKVGTCPACGAKLSRKAKTLTWIVLALIAFAVLKGVLSEGPVHTAEQKSNSMDAVKGEAASQSMPELSSGPAPIRNGALDSYTKATHPKIYAKWGAEGAKKIEAHQKLAADLIAASGRCDAVSIVGLSEQRSSPPSNIVVFVDCENGQRFYIGPNDLGSPLKSEAERAVNKESAISICRESVRAAAKFPSSVSFSAFGTVAETNKTTGGTTVYMDFESKNGIGNLIPQRATCVFPIGGKPELRVSSR